MRVVISDRTGGVPEQVTAHLESRLLALGRHFDLVSEAEVELDLDLRRSERPLHVVDITLRMIAARLEPIRTRQADRELSVAIDVALDKLDGEILRLKRRVRDHPLRIGHP